MAVITGFDDVNDRLEGTTDGDIISGLSGNDTLIGGTGRDTLNGGAGDDFLVSAGFAGGFSSKSQDDVLNGGGGFDVADLDYSDLVFVGSEKPIACTFTFGATFQIQIDGFVGATVAGCEAIQISMADGADFAVGGEANDYINGNDGRDTIRGMGGDDYISHSLGVCSLDGGSGTDTVSLNLFEDTRSIAYDLGAGAITANGKSLGKAENFEVLRISTSSGDDTITGGSRADYIAVGAGNNVVDASKGNDSIYALEGNDRIDAGAGDDSIYSQAGDDTIDAGAGNDRIEAGDGKDNVKGGAGNDYIIGGSGFLNESDTLDGGSGDDFIKLSSGNFGTGAPVLTGGSGTDTLELRGLVAAGRYDFTAGSTKLAGGGSVSGFEIFNLGGSSGNDRITVGAGNDTVDGLGGDDSIVGGAGNDSLLGNIGNDTVIGGDGNDTLFSSSFFGSETGTVNLLDGGDGDDVLFALINDDVFGGKGFDELQYGTNFSGGVTIDLQKALTGAGGSVTITGVERVVGTNSADTFRGTTRGSDMRGGFGDDTITGLNGDDTIEGGVGADRITLGKGDDTLVFFSLGDRTTSDFILDFNAKDDTIQLDGFSRIIPAGVMTDDYLIRGEFDGTPTATAAHATWFYEKSSGELYLDWDGTGSTYQTILMATFQNKPNLTAADFFVSLIG